MTAKRLFWLHIRKSAGTTARRHLHPYYVEVDRERMPINFAQARPEQYNDILNNHRVVLGPLQFRRTLFATEYLYPDWNEYFSIAFAREPVERAVSMFWYLAWAPLTGRLGLSRATRLSLGRQRPVLRTSTAFDAFLDLVEQSRSSESIFRPLGLHFTTHTAAMWDDVTDREGRLLLSAVYRVESLKAGMNRAFEEIGAEKRLVEDPPRLNERVSQTYRPTPRQRRRIEDCFPHDFDLYESAP